MINLLTRRREPSVPCAVGAHARSHTSRQGRSRTLVELAKPGGESRPGTLRRVAAQEDEYAASFARAIAEDLRAHPPAGALVRVVIRWFEGDDPLYFTVHALGSEERADVPPEDAWHPLEWPNVDQEIERTDRLTEHPGVRHTGEALKATYETGTPEWAKDDAGTISPATIDVVRRLTIELQAAGVRLDDEFAASAAHFEGWGALAVLRDLADPHVLAALEARGELPAD